jgi:hypothetical protein
MCQYSRHHTKAWAVKAVLSTGLFSSLRSTTRHSGCTLKNAIDFVFAEWNNKGAVLCLDQSCWHKLKISLIQSCSQFS